MENTNTVDVPELKVGDIFHYTWGWEQTNNDFYRVEKVNPKSVSLKKIIITNAKLLDTKCGPFATDIKIDLDNLEFKYQHELEENGKKYLTKQFVIFEDYKYIDKKRVYFKNYRLKGFKYGWARLIREKSVVFYSSWGA